MSSNRAVVADAFGARFGRDDPFMPVNIRAIYDQDSIAFNEFWEGVRPPQ
jgi:hypothetical protein